MTGSGALVGLVLGLVGGGGSILAVPQPACRCPWPSERRCWPSLLSGRHPASYAFSGLIDWPLAGLFILGGLLGGIAGVAFGKMLSARKQVLNLTFAGLVIVVGLYVVVRGMLSLAAA